MGTCLRWACCLSVFAIPIFGQDTWTALRLEPPAIVLGNAGASQALVISAVDASGLERNVTSQCNIVSSDTAVIEIDQTHARIVAKGSGRAQVRATLGALETGATVTVASKPAELTVPFSPDIVSILTIKGCNGSGCHGSPAGQSGFKLSLFGYSTEADHEMIVKAHDGRRVNLEKPEESLLLKKPAFQIPHGGGKVLPTDSEEYRIILKWLKQGAKMESGGVRLTRLEMYPSERVLTAGAQENLVVVGRLSDGSTRDMTREVRYSAGDQAVARISEDG